MDQEIHEHCFACAHTAIHVQTLDPGFLLRLAAAVSKEAANARPPTFVPNSAHRIVQSPGLSLIGIQLASVGWDASKQEGDSPASAYCSTWG